MNHEKDTITRAYIADTTVFADAFNFTLYGGRQVIHPDNLKPLDTAMLSVPYGTDSASAPIQKYRDGLKLLTAMEDGSLAYLLLGIENQSTIHYAMPVRCMVYDALQYSAQIDHSKKSYRTTSKKPDTDNNDFRRLRPKEYLSGFSKNDKLLPVITLVILFNNEEWDAPTSLHEMFDIKDSDKNLLSFVPDYKINLISPAALSQNDSEKLHSSLREVMQYIKYSGDLKKLSKLVAKNQRFRQLTHTAAMLLNAVTHSNFQIQDNEKVFDMCKAIEEMKEVSRNEGIAEGELLRAKKVALKLHEKGSDAKDIADLVDVDIKFVYQWIHEA